MTAPTTQQRTKVFQRHRILVYAVVRLCFFAKLKVNHDDDMDTLHCTLYR